MYAPCPTVDEANKIKEEKIPLRGFVIQEVLAVYSVPDQSRRLPGESPSDGTDEAN